MGVSFGTSKAPADREDLAGWVFGELNVDVSATSAGQLLTLLGLPVDQDWPAGEVAPADLLQRIAVARVEGLTVAYERWGAWHHPGYFESRLTDLEELAREAELIGGEVTWA